MQINSTQVTKTVFSDIKGADPITVIVEDTSPGAGSIIITCSGCAWTKRWNGLPPEETMSEFFCNAPHDYLIDKLGRIPVDNALLNKVITTVKVGLGTMKALALAANPIINTPPTANLPSSNNIDLPNQRSSPSIKPDNV